MELAEKPDIEGSGSGSGSSLLELHAHQDIIDLGSRPARQLLQLGEFLGVEVVGHNIVVKFPERIDKLCRKVGDLI